MALEFDSAVRCRWPVKNALMLPRTASGSTFATSRQDSLAEACEAITVWCPSRCSHRGSR